MDLELKKIEKIKLGVGQDALTSFEKKKYFVEKEVYDLD